MTDGPAAGRARHPASVAQAQRPRSSAAPAMSAVDGTSCISSGRATTRVARARRPAPCRRRRRASRRGSRRRARRRPASSTSTPMAERHASAWPRTGRAADQRRDADDGRAGAAQRVAHPGHAEDDADRDDGVARRQQDDVGLADGVEHARGGGRPVHARPRRSAAPARAARMPDPPLLEVDRALRPLALVDDHVGLDRGVGHRQQA